MPGRCRVDYDDSLPLNSFATLATCTPSRCASEFSLARCYIRTRVWALTVFRWWVWIYRFGKIPTHDRLETFISAPAERDITVSYEPMITIYCLATPSGGDRVFLRLIIFGCNKNRCSVAKLASKCYPMGGLCLSANTASNVMANYRGVKSGRPCHNPDTY
jgi:hypothetical protein